MREAVEWLQFADCLAILAVLARGADPLALQATLNDMVDPR